MVARFRSWPMPSVHRINSLPPIACSMVGAYTAVEINVPTLLVTNEPNGSACALPDRR